MFSSSVVLEILLFLKYRLFEKTLSWSCTLHACFPWSQPRISLQFRFRHQFLSWPLATQHSTSLHYVTMDREALKALFSAECRVQICTYVNVNLHWYAPIKTVLQQKEWRLSPVSSRTLLSRPRVPMTCSLQQSISIPRSAAIFASCFCPSSFHNIRMWPFRVVNNWQNNHAVPNSFHFQV